MPGVPSIGTNDLELIFNQENGVDTAIQSIYRDMEYAKSLIKSRNGKAGLDDPLDDAEESWTFIGDDTDPEIVRRLHDGDVDGSTGMQSPKPSLSTLASQGSTIKRELEEEG